MDVLGSREAVPFREAATPEKGNISHECSCSSTCTCTFTFVSVKVGGHVMYLDYQGNPPAWGQCVDGQGTYLGRQVPTQE